jgi:hypothetical protein
MLEILLLNFAWVNENSDRHRRPRKLGSLRMSRFLFLDASKGWHEVLRYNAALTKSSCTRQYKVEQYRVAALTVYPRGTSASSNEVTSLMGRWNSRYHIKSLMVAETKITIPRSSRRGSCVDAKLVGWWIARLADTNQQ